MIREALEYIVGLGDAKEHEIHGDVYSDKQLHLVKPYFPMAKAIEMHTLTSLVDYIKAQVDEMPEHMIIDVRSPEQVALYTQLDANHDREEFVVVNARVPAFPFNQFMDQEKFNINLQAKFLSDPETDKELILKFAGTVEAGTVEQYGDDGVTQKATIKTGIASKADAVVPNPVSLRPYRTFLEVAQPKSDFIFRMKQDRYDGISIAIFEADGGAWKMEATKAIKEYLEFELADYPKFTIIS